MSYTAKLSETSEIEVLVNGETIKIGDSVYQEDLPKWGPEKVKKFFYPEGSENLYAQLDQGHGCNDGCLPVVCLTKIKP